MKEKRKYLNYKELFKPNIDKLAFTIIIFILISFFFVLFTTPEIVKLKWLLMLIPSYVVSSLLYQSLIKHNLLLKVLRWIVFTPISLLILISIISQFAPANPPEDFLITHNFVDLSDILRLSKYRACAGHQTVDQWSDEPVSNMQHYITALRVDRDQVEIYAPFDGYVLSDAPHTLADGITMIPKSGVPWWPFNQWRINFPHTHVLPEFQNSPIHEMKAGDVVGYINSMDRYGGVGKGTQVRVGVLAVPPMFKNGNGEPFKKLDSVFHYMTDEVFAEYKEAIPGLQSREDMIITKEYRVAHPCKFKESGPNFDDGPPYFETGPIENLPVEEQDAYIGVGIDDIKGMNKARMCDDLEDFTNNPDCSKL